MGNMSTHEDMPQPKESELKEALNSVEQKNEQIVVTEPTKEIKTAESIESTKDSTGTKDPAKVPNGTSVTHLVKNPNTNETCLAVFNRKLDTGVLVVLSTRYGKDVGMILGELHTKDKGCSACNGCGEGGVSGEQTSTKKVPAEKGQRPDRKQKRKKVKQENSDIYIIERVATDRDLERYEKNRKKELEAITVCKEKIRKHNLDMKLVSAHYLLGESKVLFFFTADTRVDFRELVKDLVSVFKMRIELRQIGVRDESRVLGGLAVCGRDYCCHSITDKLNPVSIKMAKEQNLSLNSMKISGPCGRLLCCLSYEYDFYRDEKKKMPKEGTRIKVQDDLVKITEVNILSKKIYLSSQDGRIMVVPFSKLSYNDAAKQWDLDKEYIDEMLSG